MSDTMQLDNRQIAERAGWRVVDYHDGDYHGAALEPAHLKARDYAYTAIRNTVDEAWSHVPDYLHDTDAALTLPLDEGYQWAIYGADGYWAVDILNEVGSPDDRCSAKASTAAEAVCGAWWAWMEAQED